LVKNDAGEQELVAMLEGSEKMNFSSPLAKQFDFENDF